MDWSPEPVDILYSTQLYERPPNKLAPVTAEPEPVDDVPDDDADDVPAAVPAAVVAVAAGAAGLLPVHPASATAITTSMTAIRLAYENLMYFLQTKSPVSVPIKGNCQVQDSITEFLLNDTEINPERFFSVYLSGRNLCNAMHNDTWLNETGGPPSFIIPSHPNQR